MHSGWSPPEVCAHLQLVVVTDGETNSGHFFLKCFFCVCVLAFVDLICINKVRTSTGFGDWQACVPCPRYHGWLTSIENGMDMLEMFSHPSSPPCFIWLAMQATPSEKIKKRVWQLIFFLVYIVACPRAEPASQPKVWEIRYRFLQPSKELKWSGMFHLNAMEFSSAFLYRVVPHRPLTRTELESEQSSDALAPCVTGSGHWSTKSETIDRPLVTEQTCLSVDLALMVREK